MSEEKPDYGKVTQGDLNQLASALQSALEQFAARADARVGEIETRLERDEKISAMLMVMLGEAAALLDALFDATYENLDEEGRKFLEEKLEALRKTMLETLQSDGPTMDDGDTDTFSAMANVAE